jgi:predicted transcriptional regulator
MNTLIITVGESPQMALKRAGDAMQAIEDGLAPAPYFGVGFQNMTQLGEVFTPKRWELVEALKASGPMTIYALAKKLGRHYRNVYKDVAALTKWMAIEKNADGLVFVPWDEIDVRWPLAMAA